MKRISRAGFFTALCGLVASAGAAPAQVKCPEGRALNGDCVNPALAAAMRQAAIIFAHPKISYTAFPVLPSADGMYRYPNQLNPDPLQPSPIGPIINGVIIIP